MNNELRRPTNLQVIGAIAWREITLALRRRLVKLLFLGNLIPPLVMAVVLIANIAAKGIGVEDLGWDPLLRLIQIQAGPVLLLALGIGTPLIAGDRSKDVLFLYATRPVTPWSYTFGKMLAVALPAAALLLVPGILMAILRVGLMAEFGLLEAITLIYKVAIVAVLASCGFAGVSVGPSAATKKARWALLLALMCFVIPKALSELIFTSRAYAFSPGQAVDDVITALFEHGMASYGVVAGFVLVLWGALGAWVTAARVRREMIP